MTFANLNLDYDLVVIGGGIVGTTLAAALKNSGLRIAIIEALPLEETVKRERAYALSIMSGRILAQIGVWAQIFPKIASFSQINLSDADYPHLVRFQTSELQTDYLGYVAEHKPLLTTLQEFIADCPNIEWLVPATLQQIDYQDAYATLEVSHQGTVQKMRTALVVAADGAKSRVREWAKIPTRGWRYWQSCVTFVLKHEALANNVAFERFWTTGPMGILPLPGNRCQIVWTLPHEQAYAVQQLSEGEFMARLARHLPSSLGRCELISDRLLFPVQLMQSKSYVKPRLALIGDAAHCCHPVGGQGLNLGIRDAAALAEIIVQAHQQGKDVGSLEVLQKYANWRQLENLTILAVTDSLNRLFSNNWIPLVILRRLALWLMIHLQFLKVEVLKLMTGLKGRAPQLKVDSV